MDRRKRVLTKAGGDRTSGWPGKLHRTHYENDQTTILRRGTGCCLRSHRSYRLRQKGRRRDRCAGGRSKSRSSCSRHRRDQGDRRGRLHLRSAARDELRGDERVLRGHELRAISRRRSIEINNEHRVFTYEGHGGHHAEQRHALLDALAGSARGADGDLGAGGGKRALLLGAVDRRQYLQLWLHRQSRHRERARRLPRRWPGLERRHACGNQEGLSTRRRPSGSLFSAPSSSMPRTCRTWSEGAGGLQGAAAFRVPEAARAAGRAEDRFRPGHDRGHQSRTSSSISTRRCSSSRRRPEDKDRSGQARQHRHRTGQDLRVQGSLARTQGRRPARA